MTQATQTGRWQATGGHMGRRARTQYPDDDVVVELSSHRDRKRPTKRGPGRASAKPAKQSHRQRVADAQVTEQSDLSLKRVRPTEPLTAAQGDHLDALYEQRIVLATGPSGTGKTYIPVGVAVDMLSANQIERIVCLRPAVEAGRPLGFLPGSVDEKISPFFASIRRSLTKKMGNASAAERWMKSAMDAGKLVFMSIQHLRGETLENCFVITDEPQNCTYVELKLILTRMGEGSRFAFCGDQDPWQNDLGEGFSGWPEFVARLAPLTDAVTVIRYTEADVVRDPLLKRILPYL